MEDLDLLKKLEKRLPLLDELADTLGSSSFSAFLKREIAHTVSEAVSKSTSPLLSDLKELRQFLNDQISSFKDSLSDVKAEIPDLDARLTSVSGSIQDLSSELFGVRTDLEQKPTQRDVERIAEKLTTLAGQAQVNALETALSHCADKDEIRNLEERLEDVKGLFQDYPTEQQLKDAIDQVQESCKTLISPLAATSDLQLLADSLSFATVQANAQIEDLRKHFQAETTTLKRECGELKAITDSLPWKKESSFLLEEIGKKATRLEIRQFKEDASALLQTAGLKIKEVTETLAEFDSVLRHYDEVFLLKASRDDLKSLQRKFDEAVDTSSLKAQIAVALEGLEALKEDIQSMDSELEVTRDRLEIVAKDQASIPRQDNFVDSAAFFTSLAEVRDLLGSKADRADVYGLKEGKCEKREIELISGDLHMLKRQVESIAGTLYAFVKGYVEEEPSPLLAEKQKSHLLGHSLSLLNWISGSELEESPTLKSRPRGLSSRRQPSLGSTLPHVSAFNTPKTRPRTRKDSHSGPHSPSKSLIDSARW